MHPASLPSRTPLRQTGFALSLVVSAVLFSLQSVARLASGDAPESNSANTSATLFTAPGALVPWTTLEAESAITTGSILGPDFAGHTPAREASGRKCVRLTKGQSLTFKSPLPASPVATGFVVRYCLPDSPDGRGQDASLSLSLGDSPQPPLLLTSRLSHLYGPYPFTNTPVDGDPRNFWDETRRLLPPSFQSGETLRLQNDGPTDILIDGIDLEPVPAPLGPPEGALSVTDFGAVPDDTTDDRAAFQAAITAAHAQNKPLYIPPGRFTLKGTLQLSNITLQGAGIWYTTLTAAPGETYPPAERVSLQGAGSNIHLSHFALTGALNYRNDSEPNDGIGGSFGAGSTLSNLWIEHTKTGFWLTNSDGLQITDCRIRNTIADGINLCLGMRNTVVRNCSTRGTGDDCFAMWPATYAPADLPHANNRFDHCTAALPFLAQAFPIYGGENNAVTHCLAVDIPYGAGIYPSTTFPTPSGFHGTTLYQHLRLLRTGDADGAVGLVANAATPPGLLPDVRIDDVEILDPPTFPIRFTSLKDGQIQNAHLSSIRITGPTTAPLTSTPTARGSAKLENISLNGKPVTQFNPQSPALKVSP